MIALGRALVARGHEVTLQTWRRWEGHVRAEGIAFAAAPEYQVFPQGPEPLDFYEAVVHATRDTLGLVRETEPEVVVADILTLAPALAAEVEGRRWATLIPHVYPHGRPEHPIYSLGARMPRSAAGRALWRRAQPIVQSGLELGRRELNETRARLGLPPLAHVHGGISRELAIVATFPQLEYPREWPANVHVVGPLMWEPPAEDGEGWAGALEAREASAEQRPLVLVAPSTAQDGEHRMLRAALLGLGELARARARHLQPPAAPRAAARPGEREGARVARLLARDAAQRRGALPRRARHARPRALPRLRRRRVPLGRGHERERCTPGLGGSGGAAAAAVRLTPHGQARRRAGIERAGNSGEGAGDGRLVGFARPWRRGCGARRGARRAACAAARSCCIIEGVDDAVERFLAATEANDMAGLASTLAPDATLPSPLLGSAVFKGREDVVGVLSIVYSTIRNVRWEPPFGQGAQRVAIAEARIAGLRIGDAMVFELGADGLITRVRPHLRPLLATFVFFLMIGPRVATRPAMVLRAVRR